MAESNLFKPQSATSGLGKKSAERGQFVNPPAYPEVSGFSGSAKAADNNDMKLETKPSARSGKV